MERDFLLPTFGDLLADDAIAVAVDDGCVLVGGTDGAVVVAAVLQPSANNAAKLIALIAKHNATSVAIVLEDGDATSIDEFFARIAPFAFTPTSLQLHGADLSDLQTVQPPHQPTPPHHLATHVTPEMTIEIERRAQAVGAAVQVEYGTLTVHVLGLEVARFDPEDQQLHVGVGLHDRLARFDGAAEAFGEDDLHRTARQTQLHRFDGSDSTHPLATLKRNRWRREQLLANHGVAAWNVDPAEPSVGTSIDDVVGFRDDTQLICCVNPHDLGAVSAAAAIRQREFGVAPLTLSFWQEPAQAVLRQVQLVDPQLGPITVRVDPSPWSS
jgi:hypothetical protein